MKARALMVVTVSGLVLVASFFLGRASARKNEKTDDACPSDPPVARPVDRAWPQPTRVSAPALAVCPPGADDDPVALSEARRKRAAFLLDGVFNQLADQSRMGVDQAEARADYVLPYLSGVLNGALQADPQIRGAFSAEFTSSLCERALADDQTISVAHMALGVPGVATESGFECFFSKAKEGVPLWTMLDAWRRSGLPKTPAIARLQSTATDSRTTRRFLSDDEARAQRVANIPSAGPTN